MRRTRTIHPMKRIEYTIENHKRIHITSRGNRMVIWWNDYYVWIAPESKLWASKKYQKSECELIENNCK